ncbi:MAG: hypothetical protein VZR06_02580 [Butyrivibrio sp.]|nr:hypothetical protein [Butyrivibrio sp.]
MDNQKALLVVVIITGVVIFADIIWRAVYYLKHKRDEKALEVLTKAQAASAWTLWLWLIVGGGLSSFIFKEGGAISLNNIGTFTFVLLGVQCLLELCSGCCYSVEQAKAKKSDIGQANIEQA